MAGLCHPRRREMRSFSLWQVLAVAVTGVAIALAVARFQTGQSATRNRMADEVLARHARSLLGTHLVDIASSDQRMVKSWFEGKIDFAPDVHDFAMSGFPLIGGRLDYLSGKTVATLVYQRNKHPINVFIAPAKRGEASSAAAISRRDYNLISWAHAGMNYWAVSDLDPAELREFSSMLKR